MSRLHLSLTLCGYPQGRGKGQDCIMTTYPLASFLSAGSIAAASRSPIDAILGAVRQHLGMEIAFAARYLSKAGRLAERQFTHLSSDLPLPASPGHVEPVENSYCWHILEGRLPELIQDAQAIPFAQQVPITSALPVGCHISVPLRFRDGSLYGSFCALSRSADYSLTERDLATVRAFADLAMDQIEMQRDADSQRDAAVRRVENAIGSGRPAIVLQPIHNLVTGRPIGVEALSRFDGERSPSDWFAEAADVGMGVELELAAIRGALATLPFVPEGVYFGVNASPQLILSGALEPLIDAAPPGRLVVEITEHEAVEDYGALRTALAPVRERIRVAVDDVGAGYSGLKHILDLRPDTLKLDMSLTRDVDIDPARRALIGAMVDFAAEIGCNMVAEGVETTGERDALKALGVEGAQGWLYSRALAPTDARRYLLDAAAAAERGVAAAA